MSRKNVVDLRSGIDQTYYQGSANECQAFKCKALIETMFDRSPTHKGQRVSARFLHNRGREETGTLASNSGQTDSTLSEVFRRYGFCLEGDMPDVGIHTPVGFAESLKALRNAPVLYERIPYVNDDQWESICRSIDWGIPVGAVIDVTQEFTTLSGPWQTHAFDASGPKLYEHGIAIVGYDRAKRIALIENSWGPGWGDGGFGGISADKFMPGPQRCITQLWRFETLPVDPVPVEDFMPEIATLPDGRRLSLINAAMDAERARIAGPLLEAAGPNMDIQKLLDEAVRRGVSDQEIEFAARWPRKTVRDFLKANPHIKADALVRAPL